MATVYLAHDLRHERKVAIKVLRPELAAVIGAERFVREIRTIAALQHPHILGLIDSGEVQGTAYYVMPFIEGESLRERLTREKQLPITDAVRIAIEVASALDYAHRHGVIHRDIKPENILLHDGQALVADFGIALALSQAGGTRMTETGMSLGTPHYMSPEQAMGEREITVRSDVYALGVVTYEMLSGDPPFTGSTAQAVVARVLTESPRPLSTQRHTIPGEVETAVLTALEKLPADRFSTAHEFAEALQGKVGTATRNAGKARLPVAVGWRVRLRDPFVLVPTLVAVALLVVAIRLAGRTESPALGPVRFVMAATDSARPFDQFPWPAAISPDGDAVVYSVQQNATNSMLYLLRTDQLDAHPIAGTTDAFQPVFSPDGKWLAFGVGDLERKVRLDGSAPVTIAAVGTAANGADWTVGDEIVLGAQGAFHGLSRVSAAGGEAVALTQPDTAHGERDHLWPIALADGRTIVFAIWTGSLASSRLAITSLTNSTVVPLGLSGIRPLAVLDLMLIYVQADGTVMAVSLDAGGKKISGRPIPVHDPVPVASANNGNSGIFISRDGALVASRGGARGLLAWVSLGGRTESVLPDARGLDLPRLSPDERRIAVVVQEGQNGDVWIYDRSLATFSRLTSVGTVTSAEWSADGARVLFTAGGGKERSAVWEQVASGASPPEKLFESPLLTPLATMSPDGKSLLVNSLSGSSWDIFRVRLDSERVPRSYVATTTDETAPAFSPDGKWVALVSRESGRNEVYVRSFPDPSSKLQVSASGGTQPVWSADGRRLYYRAGARLLAARVTLSPTFALLGRDTVLVNTSLAAGNFFGASYDVPRDGRRILAILPGVDDFQLVVSPNWITELRRRLAENGSRK
jgi:Tol biopolymer transport system component